MIRNRSKQSATPRSRSFFGAIKKAAVFRKCTNGDMGSTSSIAKELAIHPSTLRRWCRSTYIHPASFAKMGQAERGSESISPQPKSPFTFLLGAGASKPGGLPLAQELFRPSFITDLQSLGSWAPMGKERISAAIRHLDRIERSADGELIMPDDWDDVSLPISQSGLLEALIDVLYWAETAQFQQDAGRRDVTGMDHYFYFHALAHSTVPPDHEGTIITLNYDLNIEQSCSWDNINYGSMGSRIAFPSAYGRHLPEQSAKMQVLKPNGSLNWLHCTRCRTVLCGKDNMWRARESLPLLNLCPDCGRFTRPLLVPPYYQTFPAHLAAVREDMAIAFRHTQMLLIIGYSLPEYDGYMIDALRANLPHTASILVIDPLIFTDSSRYRRLGRPLFGIDKSFATVMDMCRQRGAKTLLEIAQRIV